MSAFGGGIVQPVEGILEHGAEVLDRGAVFRFLVEPAVDHVDQLRRQVGPVLEQRRELPVEGTCGRGRRGTATGILPAPGLVEGEAERVDVPRSADFAAFGLFRRHVGERAKYVAGHGQVIGVGEAGNAEIHQLGRPSPALDDQVRRLQVAVDDAA